MGAAVSVISDIEQEGGAVVLSPQTDNSKLVMRGEVVKGDLVRALRISENIGFVTESNKPIEKAGGELDFSDETAY
ncbi:hypothetical protein ACOSQ3_014796 [Xanthoceras sorbifolium]